MKAPESAVQLTTDSVSALPKVFRAESLFTRVPLWFYAVPALLIASIVLFVDHPWLAASAVALAVTTFVLVAKGSRLEVGTDGVALRWLWRRRFFPREEIAGACVYDQGFGRSRLSGVALTLRNGSRIEIPLGERGAGMACRAVRQALGFGGSDVSAAAAVALARGDLSHRAWFLRLRALGAGVADGARRAAIPEEELWAVVSNPTAAPSERAAAAVALGGSRTEDDAKARLVRVAAETVDPKLRALLERTAVDAADGELEQAFIELEDEHRARA